MILYLLRHSLSREARLGETDEQRDLTNSGEKLAQELGIYLSSIKIVPGKIFTSPYIRAVQTSKNLLKGTNAQVHVEECSELSSGETLFLSSKRLFNLAVQENLSSVMFIGHQPDLGELVGKLLGNNIPIRISPCTLIGLDVSSWRIGGAVLTHLVPNMAPADHVK